jgi:hypothetical protein
MELRLNVYLLTIMLLGALTVPASSEEEVRSGARGDSKTPATNVNTPVRESKTPDGIDTRIVPSRRLGDGRNRVGAAKGNIELPAVRSFPARRMLSPPGAVNQTRRNAIGASIGPEKTERPDGMHPNFQSVRQNPAVGTAGVGRPTSLTTTRPVVPSVAVNRGTINRTGLTRLGFRSSSLGGPAKAVTGINGTTIRPKH